MQRSGAWVLINRAAVIAAACKVFLFTDNNSKAEEWAAAVIMGRVHIARIIDKNNGPFYVHIGREAQSHVSPVRFVGTGGKKIIEESTTAVPVIATEVQPKSESPVEPSKQDRLFPKN